MVMTDNYIREIQVTASPSDVYVAITTGFEHWWTKPDNHFHNIGDQATMTFLPQKSYWTFEAMELLPNKRVVLECVDAYHIILDKPESSQTEWLGTSLVFNIEAEGSGARIVFEHVGLKPKLECFEICEEGWNHFFVDSLNVYLNTGTGKAHQARQ